MERLEPPPGAERSPGRQVWVPAIAAGVLVMIVLGALQPQYMEHWDEIQLSLGVERFDVISHHPHPPGYYVFVILGRVVNSFVHDPPTALRYVSAFAVAMIVTLLGRMMPRRIGLGTRVLFLLGLVGFAICSPLVLRFGVLALTYSAEAACWLAILIGFARRPRGAGLAGLMVFMGVCTGLRQTLGVWGLFVFVILALRWRGWVRPFDAAVAAAGFAAGLILWFVPMLAEVGGWEAYRLATERISLGNIWSKAVFNIGLPHVMNVRLPLMLKDFWSGLGPFLFLSVAAVVARCHPRSRTLLARWDSLLLGAVTAFVFYFLLIYDSAGYVLAVILPLVAYGFLGMCAVVTLVPSPGRWIAALGPLVAAVILCFLPGGLAAGDNAGYRGLLQHDEMVERRVHAVRRQFNPQTTLLVTSREYWTWSFRHVMYYLPEFATLQLVIDPFFLGMNPRTPYLTGRGRRINHFGPDGRNLQTLPEISRQGGLQQVVYMIPDDAHEFVSEDCLEIGRQLEVGMDDHLWVFPVSGVCQMSVLRQRLECKLLK